jgi:hypothetical protein
MPIHLDDVDVASELAGSRSALIVPCNMCPAVTVAVKRNKPFIRLLKSFLKSVPFERHVEALQSRLREGGMSAEVFRSRLPHQWFMCMWTSGRRRKLERQARKHDAVIVLGCDSATETVRDSVRSAGCTVVQGMQVAGVMNATLRLDLLGNVSFQDCKIVPLSLKAQEDGMPR